MKKTAAHNTKPLRLSTKTVVFGLLTVLLLVVVCVRFSIMPSTPTTNPSVTVDKLAGLDLSGASPSVRKQLTRQIDQVRETPEDADAWGELGITLLVHQLNEPAVDCFRLAIERQPDEFKWHYLVGHGLMFMDPGGSSEALAQAATVNPDYLPAHMLLVEVLMKAGRLKEAEARLSGTLPAEVDNHPWAMWQRSRLAFLQGDYESSLSLAEEFYGKGHVSREVLRHLLKLRRRTDPDADLSDLRQKLHECPMEALNWDCPVLRYVYSRKVDHEAAIMTAQQLLHQGNPRGAMSVFQNALSADPESPELLFQLAQAWQQLGDINRADAILQQAEKFETNSFRIQIQRAKFAVARKEWKSARELVENAISVKPDSSDAHCVLAVILQAEGDQQSARDYVENALRLDPQHAVATQLLANWSEN